MTKSWALVIFRALALIAIVALLGLGVASYIQQSDHIDNCKSSVVPQHETKTNQPERATASPICTPGLPKYTPSPPLYTPVAKV